MCIASTYDPVREQETFHAFALRNSDGAFASFSEVEAFARQREIPVVPVLFRGRFQSRCRYARFFRAYAHRKPSALGGAREGVVLRLARGFSEQEFSNNVCKSVRVGTRANRRTLEQELETMQDQESDRIEASRRAGYAALTLREV